MTQDGFGKLNLFDMEQRANSDTLSVMFKHLLAKHSVETKLAKQSNPFGLASDNDHLNNPEERGSMPSIYDNKALGT
jgi:hypothetical protein